MQNNIIITKTYNSKNIVELISENIEIAATGILGKTI
jgi:hypothetical protein